MVSLIEPERFLKREGVLRFFGVELFHPLAESGDDLAGFTFAQLNLRAVADAIDRMFQVIEQGGDRLAVDGHWFLQRLLLVDQAVDTTVLLVAVGIADVVLHVADDHVLPVRDVEPTVCAENRVGGAEILVIAVEEAVGRGAPDLAGLELVFPVLKAVALEFVTLEPEVANRVAH